MRRDFFFKHLKIIFLSQLDVYMQGARVRVGGASWGNPPLPARYGRTSGRPAASAASVPSYGTSKTHPVAWGKYNDR